MLQRKFFTKEQALQKIKHYASYQERSHQEVKEKLYSYLLRKAEVEEIISTLISENYLNEERFAIQYASGKFRIKHWGRQKIKYELQQKRISAYCIKKAMTVIDEKDYLSTLENLAKKKWISLKGEQDLSRHTKTHSYLMQKGYESNLIQNVIGELKTSRT
ncbi:MAG TPA: regulatory protein RecX [Segetibacter sp.]|jgi:regulatory protein